MVQYGPKDISGKSLTCYISKYRTFNSLYLSAYNSDGSY